MTKSYKIKLYLHFSIACSDDSEYCIWAFEEPWMFISCWDPQLASGCRSRQQQCRWYIVDTWWLGKARWKLRNMWILSEAVNGNSTFFFPRQHSSPRECTTVDWLLRSYSENLFASLSTPQLLAMNAAWVYFHVPFLSASWSFPGRKVRKLSVQFHVEVPRLLPSARLYTVLLLFTLCGFTFPNFARSCRWSSSSTCCARRGLW